MSNAYYPKLDLSAVASLSGVYQQMELHSDYLDNANCPYDDVTKEQLRKMLAPRVIEKVVEVEKIVERKIEIATKAAESGGQIGRKLKQKSSGVDMDAASQEIQDLRKELQQLKVDSKGLQTADKIQIIKTRAGLVEKLISMDEKANNLKKMALFQSVILGVLDDLVPNDRRGDFMKRIEPFAQEE